MEETFCVRSVLGLYKGKQRISKLRVADVRSEKLVAEAVKIWKTRERGKSAVGSRYQAMANED
jgi:hypothetical protein